MTILMTWHTPRVDGLKCAWRCDLSRRRHAALSRRKSFDARARGSHHHLFRRRHTRRRTCKREPARGSRGVPSL